MARGEPEGEEVVERCMPEVVEAGVLRTSACQKGRTGASADQCEPGQLPGGMPVREIRQWSPNGRESMRGVERGRVGRLAGEDGLLMEYGGERSRAAVAAAAGAAGQMGARSLGSSSRKGSVRSHTASSSAANSHARMMDAGRQTDSTGSVMDRESKRRPIPGQAKPAAENWRP
ncbi:hypothetical protein K491DRAFT_720411 [Lophiostoma macrostomum CBS 122681]|uniref:Uncharacterized protein n=1 Tax=Lophiostoma macrostomum CBS 122681 TaxID=1314788 RepID=A0A6A6STD6_9PLEO|nr:hypothetical protein K491DRAFT_720411 [Lophiostoma macrostomum CBS 122681]